MKELGTKENLGQDIPPKSRKWPPGNGYGKRYGTKEKKGTGKSYRQNGTQNQIYHLKIEEEQSISPNKRYW